MSIKYKSPSLILVWLDTALQKEKEKYHRCPVLQDWAPGHEAAQGWGYVVVAYSLVEQAFKALLHVQDKTVPHDHPLSPLFNSLDDADKDILREYFTDYRATIGGRIGDFRSMSVDEFLANLDGDKDIGSFDWRYYLTEERRSQEMPLVSVDYLHETAHGITRILEWVVHGHSHPLQHTHSWRLRRKRVKKYTHWYNVRMNSPDWHELSDRVEQLWGPDYLGRYDLYLFQGRKIKTLFAALPGLAVPIVDKRREIETFDVEEGYRTIGVTFPRCPTQR